VLQFVQFTKFFIICAQQRAAGKDLPIHEVSMSHMTTHHSRWDSSEQVSSLSQRPLPDNAHNRQTSVPPVGFEPMISAGEQPQTYALDRTATGTSTECYLNSQIKKDEMGRVMLRMQEK